MIERCFRFLFWSAIGLCFIMAVIPVAIQTHGSDKVQHMVAFAVLTLLGLAAYPRVGRLALAAGLAGFGALIEFAQALPIVSRDSDLMDWVTDVVAVLAVLATAEVVRRMCGAARRA